METISYDKFIAQFRDKAYKEDIPINGSFELTPFCNLNCKMCYVHLLDYSAKHKMLSGLQWIDIMKDAIERGMITALLTGGEAMTHPDFWIIYMFLINQGISIRVKTNGLLLNKDNLKRFTSYPPYLIDISLYGCDSKSYLAVTEVDAYQNVVDNIHMAIEAGLHLRIMITPSTYMEPWTKQVMELAKSFGLQVIVNNLLMEPNDNTGRKKADFELNKEDSNRILKLKKELFPVKLMSKEEEEEIYGSIEKRADVSKKGLYCNGGRIGFAINWDGTMGPCLNFPRNIICAHPIEDGFSNAWEEVNAGIKNFTIPHECHSCSINTKCHYCPTQHSKVAAKNLCDPTVCDYWHRVYNNSFE